MIEANTYKKLICSILVVALLNLMGCYSFESMTVPKYKQVVETEGKPDKIIVKTIDSQEYQFSESNFYIENDTLYEKVNTRELSIGGKIALNEIASIQLEDFSYKYPSPMSVSQYQKIEAETGKPDDIYLTKLDSTRYHFMKNDYWIKSDILYGNGKLLLAAREELVGRKIALSDIETFQLERFSWLYTSILFLLLAGYVLLIYIGLREAGKIKG